MANEVTIVRRYGSPPGHPRSYKCADTDNIPYGSLCVLSGEETAVVSKDTNQPQIFIGVAGEDKNPNISGTQITILQNVDIDVVSVSGAAADLPVHGFYVSLSGQNLVKRTAIADLSGNSLISGLLNMVGQADETASASERIVVKVRK